MACEPDDAQRNRGPDFEEMCIRDSDKPDALEGPFFEETIYVTPSREPAEVQQELLETTAQAVRALGFRHGPVHAELRHNSEGGWMLEMHARPIGGLCARSLRFTGGIALEELILRHALGEDVSSVQLADGASGCLLYTSRCV